MKGSSKGSSKGLSKGSSKDTRGSSKGSSKDMKGSPKDTRGSSTSPSTSRKLHPSITHSPSPLRLSRPAGALRLRNAPRRRFSRHARAIVPHATHRMQRKPPHRRLQRHPAGIHVLSPPRGTRSLRRHRRRRPGKRGISVHLWPTVLRKNPRFLQFHSYPRAFRSM